MPLVWNRIYEAQIEAWRAAGNPDIPKPPVPLILAAWHEPHLLKILRWRETQEWSQNHGFAHLIPALSEADYFYG